MLLNDENGRFGLRQQLGKNAYQVLQAGYRPGRSDLPASTSPAAPVITRSADKPILRTSLSPSGYAGAKAKPWGVQVAGNFNRSGNQAIPTDPVSVFSAALEYEPVVSRVRSPIGRRGVYAVRIGADARADANSICSKLQNSGAACVVTRNH